MIRFVAVSVLLACMYERNFSVLGNVLSSVSRVASPAFNSLGWDDTFLEVEPQRQYEVGDRSEGQITGKICRIFRDTMPDCHEKIPLREIQPQMIESIRRKEISEDPALAERFGTKHANIEKLINLFSAFPVPGVYVPSPIGIDKEDVLRFLHAHDPSIQEDWHEIQSMYVPGQITLTSEMKQLLSNIQIKIGLVFAQHYQKFAWPTSLDGSLSGQTFAVRSTSAEDTKKNSNAGGNQSESYVNSDHKSLAEAMSSVVSSYFSEESLGNRLVAQQNPFEDFDKIQLSVTVQPMVGEKIGGESNPALIPRSFVMSTNQPIYIGNELFRVMRISTTYGHGEGIVGGFGIPADSVLILESTSEPGKLYFLYDNQLKTERLAPFREEDGKIVKRTVSNPQSLQQKPVLSAEQIYDLYIMGLTIESSFKGEPTDIEGIIQPLDTCSSSPSWICITNPEFCESPEYFPVQARPLIQETLLPTRLKYSLTNPLKVKTIIPGKGSVLTISDPKEVLIADTLLAARNLYQQDPSRYKAIVIFTPEPKESHAFLNFGAWGVPCFYTSKKGKINKLLDSIDEDHLLVIDTQRGDLHRWSSSSPIEVEEGIGVHPADFAISLPNVQDFAITPYPGRKTQEEQIERIISKLSSVQTAQEALEAMDPIYKNLVYLKAQIDRLNTTSLSAPALQRLHVAQSLYDTLTRTCLEMSALIDTSPWQKESMQWLLYTKVLKQLLIEPHAAVGQYSLLDTPSLLEDIEILEEVQKHAPHFLDIFLLGRQSTPEAFGVWAEFLVELEPIVATGEISLKQLAEFKDIILKLDHVGALPLYLIFFQNTSQSPVERFHAIMKENSPKVFAEIIQANEKIQTLRAKVENFANPKDFAQSWNALQELLEKYNADWISKFKDGSSGPLAQVMVIQTLDSLIEVCDLSTKAMKSNTEVPANIRAQQMKDMLKVYLPWGEALSETMIADYVLGLWDNSHWYFANLHKQLTDIEPIADMLDPSKDFSVSGAMLGSRSSARYHMPETLEDVFTLWHQNSLFSLAYRSQVLISPYLSISQMPPLQKEMMQEISSNRFPAASLIGIQCKDNRIKVLYNVPLRMHSSRFSLEYDLVTQKLFIQGQFLGDAKALGAPSFRWEGIDLWFHFLEQQGIIIPYSEGFYTQQELSFFWELPSLEMGKRAIKEYLKIARSTIEVSPWWLFPSQQILDEDITAQWVNTVKSSPKDVENPLSWIILLHAQEKGLISPNSLQELASQTSFAKLLSHPEWISWFQETNQLHAFLPLLARNLKVSPEDFVALLKKIVIKDGIACAILANHGLGDPLLEMATALFIKECMEEVGYIRDSNLLIRAAEVLANVGDWTLTYKALTVYPELLLPFSEHFMGIQTIFDLSVIYIRDAIRSKL